MRDNKNAPVTAQAPEHLLYRLRKHADDDRNSAFARSTMREALQYLDAAQAPQDMVSVCKHDANAYCRILRVLGMEEEGDPVAEVERLVAQGDKLPGNGAIQFAHDVLHEVRAMVSESDVAHAQIGQAMEGLRSVFAAQAPAVPPEQPLPDLMMASYHEAIGWNACRAAMLASTTASAPVVPEGWRLVPAKPTIAMCIHGSEVTDKQINGHAAAQVYEIMLHLAPTPPASAAPAADGGEK